jgi:hypothetical protein
MSNDSINEYFALDLDADELIQKVEDYYSTLESLGYLDRINRSFSVYYGNSFDATSYKITASGKKGEFSNLSGNHYRAFLQQQLSLITSERPAFDVRPINTDYTSITQSILGEQILDYYLSAKKLESILRSATEKGVWGGEGFVHMKWDSTAGEIFSRDPETGAPIMTGDIFYSTGNSLDCARDIYKEGEPDWLVWREFVNKYELAAKYQEKAQEILAIPSVTENTKNSNYRYTRAQQSDMVALYTFYHRKSSVLPRGKYAYFIEGEILQQGDLPYDNIPVYRITPANVSGTCLGYSQAFDMLGNQEAYDRIFSANMSNVLAFARQCVLIPKDAGVDIKEFGDGLSVLEYDATAGKIEPLQLTMSSPETYSMLDRVERNMSVFSGINDVVRGDPEANLRSGNALALVAAQAIKFNSGLQNSYARLLEDVGTATLEFLKKFARSPRFAFIVGKNHRSMMKEFTGEQLSGVSRVEVQIASALSKTQAGRIQIADNLLQAQMIKRPEQYLAVIETGKLEPIVEAEQAELLNIRSENEMLQAGSPPVIVALDNHMLHIREHKTVIDDPAARENPAVVQATLNHIQEHLMQWQQLSATQPALLQVLGMQPIPPMPMPPPEGQGSTPEVQQAGPEQTAEEIQPPAPAQPPENAPPEDQAAFQQLNLQ